MRNGIILNNKILDLMFISLAIAQLFKVFFPVLKGEKPKFSKLFETGGMPSSHSSSMATLFTITGLVYGTSSIYFAISFGVAMIVMYDATGIRREAGKHAKALNKIMFDENNSLFKSQEFKEFKEFLGHSPFEVFMGCLLGILVPFVFRGYFL